MYTLIEVQGSYSPTSWNNYFRFLKNDKVIFVFEIREGAVIHKAILVLLWSKRIKRNPGTLFFYDKTTSNNLIGVWQCFTRTNWVWTTLVYWDTWLTRNQCATKKTYEIRPRYLYLSSHFDYGKSTSKNGQLSNVTKFIVSWQY